MYYILLLLLLLLLLYALFSICSLRFIALVFDSLDLRFSSPRYTHDHSTFVTTLKRPSLRRNSEVQCSTACVGMLEGLRDVKFEANKLFQIVSMISHHFPAPVGGNLGLSRCQILDAALTWKPIMGAYHCTEWSARARQNCSRAVSSIWPRVSSDAYWRMIVCAIVAGRPVHGESGRRPSAGDMWNT